MEQPNVLESARHVDLVHFLSHHGPLLDPTSTPDGSESFTSLAFSMEEPSVARLTVLSDRKDGPVSLDVRLLKAPEITAYNTNAASWAMGDSWAEEDMRCDLKGKGVATRGQDHGEEGGGAANHSGQQTLGREVVTCDLVVLPVLSGHNGGQHGRSEGQLECVFARKKGQDLH